MIRHILIAAILLVSTPWVGAGMALAQDMPQIDENGWIWVPAHRNEADQVVRGFYRQPHRDGFNWVDPYVAEDGVNVAGYWENVEEAAEGHVYVRGHRDDEGRYADGYWRTTQYDDSSWIDGYYDDEGSWNDGQWMPLERRDGYTWVPGHIGPSGYWIPGHWRLDARDGYSWADGYYGDDGWYSGCWHPSMSRSGSVWVPGYILAGIWHIGYWRSAYRNGYSWVPGHWNSGIWSHGHWNSGSWRWGRHHRRSHYAGYHHQYGHKYTHKHRRTRKVRYGTAKHHGKVKARPVATSRGERRGFSKRRRRPAMGFRQDYSVPGKSQVGKRPTTRIQPRTGRLRVRQPRRGMDIRRVRHSQPHMRPVPATNPRYRRPGTSGARGVKHFGPTRKTHKKRPSFNRAPTSRPSFRRTSPTRRATKRPARIRRTKRVAPRRKRVAPRRRVAPRKAPSRAMRRNKAPSRATKSSFQRRKVTPTKKRSGRRSVTRDRKGSSRPAKSGRRGRK